MGDGITQLLKGSLIDGAWVTKAVSGIRLRLNTKVSILDASNNTYVRSALLPRTRSSQELQSYSKFH